MTLEISDKARALLEKPVLVNLATVRPDGAPQVNPMWFKWDGELLWFTHTSYRQKYKNIAHEPRVSIAFLDPENPYGYMEVRGVVETVEDDPEATMYQTLSEWYDGTAVTPGDAADRVKIGVRPTRIVQQ
ncbi:PPOX class F420-dependent oxidoreductase [Catenulispora yoronensis]|uniref:PPOX class F420-dependent oxidoreductase n=1 Tax=Catenulispora yoronensis TaxID=450799 RepID=A0ABP5FTE7_9ACTN